MTQSLFEYIIIFKLKSKNNNYIQNFIYRIDFKNVNKSISHKIICFLSFLIKKYIWKSRIISKHLNYSQYQVILHILFKIIINIFQKIINISCF